MNTQPSNPFDPPFHLVDALMQAQQAASLLALLPQPTINGAPVHPGQTAAVAATIAASLDRVVDALIGA